MALQKFCCKLFIFLLLPTITVFAASPIKIDQLYCEYLQNPLGIDIPSPRFGWVMSSSQRNQFQSAYEIVISDDASSIQQSAGNIWSTGKVVSNNSTLVEYSGPALKSFTKYYWRVRVYDQNDQVSQWSAVNSFETAMINPSDWKAKWIGDGVAQPAKEEDRYKNDPMPLFKKVFSASKNISSARLYISGLGYYEAYINGRKVGDHVLDPGWTAYQKQVLYSVYDVTSMIRKGNNVTGLMLGNGWWNPLPFKLFGRFDIHEHQQTDRPCVKAEIHIRYADGSEEVVPTDETWKTALGPVMRNNVYLGEHYDARKEKPEWFSVGDNSWSNAVIVAGPSGKLTSQLQPPIRITTVVKPVSVAQYKKDTFIVNMGQNFAGVARIKVKGAAGTKITIRYGEGLFKDSSLNVMTTVATQIKKGSIKAGPGAPETAWQEDSYTLKGKGVETWSPRFTFHGFQYLEITGWPGTPTVNDVEGLRMNSDLQSTGTFTSSNEMFNRLHEMIQWTFKSNIFSVQSDCPGREKLGYGADMVVSAEAFIYNYNMFNFYRKSIHDFANDQQSDGGITETAPYVGIADRGYTKDSGPLGWELAFPFLQHRLYEFYGDKRIIAEQYNAFTRQMDFLQSKAIEGLFHWDISDHEALDTKPEAFTAACFYYHHALLAQEFAVILGKTEDSVKYSKLSQRIKSAIVRKYLIPNTGLFDNATQSAQIFGIWYHLTDDMESAFKVLMSEFERHNWHLSSGIFGVKMMFDILRAHNKNDIAYRIADQRDFPGWGNMVESGATTLWESWEFPETGPSRNHPMFGSIDEWFYRSLLGINAALPGFEKVLIKPQPAGDLTWATGSYKSIRGEIKSSWKIEGNQFTINVSIPVNTKAEVRIPAKENATISENGKPVKVLRYADGFASVEVGSGDYSFATENR